MTSVWVEDEERERLRRLELESYAEQDTAAWGGQSSGLPDYYTPEPSYAPPEPYYEPMQDPWLQQDMAAWGQPARGPVFNPDAQLDPTQVEDMRWRGQYPVQPVPAPTPMAPFAEMGYADPYYEQDMANFQQWAPPPPPMDPMAYAEQDIAAFPTYTDPSAFAQQQGFGEQDIAAFQANSPVTPFGPDQYQRAFEQGVQPYGQLQAWDAPVQEFDQRAAYLSGDQTGLHQFDPNAFMETRPAGPSVGDIAQWGMSAHVVPEPWREAVGDIPVVGPGLQYGLESLDTPFGLATLPFGPGSLPKNLAINAAANIGGRAAAEEYAGSDLPFADNPWAQLGVGIAAGGGVEGALRGAPAAARAGVRGIDRLTEFEEPLARRLTGMVSEAGEGPNPFSFFEEGTSARQFPDRMPEGVADIEIRPQTLDESKMLIGGRIKDEFRIRLRGTADEEIHAGRQQQAAGIAEGFEGSQGMTLAERNAAMSAGATAGTLRKTFAEPLDIPDEHLTAVLDDYGQQQLAGNRAFDVKRFGMALQKLTNGEGLQPAEIKMLGGYFGPKVQRDIENINRLRPSPKADLTPEDEAFLATMKGRERDLQKQEIVAQRQMELADRLTETSRLNPTDKRYAVSIEQAQERAIKAANKVDEIERRILESATREYQRMAGVEFTKALRDVEKNDLVGKAMKQIRQGVNDAEKVADYESAIQGWLWRNDFVLAGVESNRGLQQHFMNVMAGDTSDSLVTHYLRRRGLIADTLQARGMSPELTGKVSKTLLQAELREQFPSARYIKGKKATGSTPEVLGRWEGLPESVDRALRHADEQAGPVAQGAARLNQEFKNAAFGPFDFGVALLQIPLTLIANGPLMLAGLVNRALTVAHLPHMNVASAGPALDRQVANMLDGQAPRGASIGFTDFAQNQGTALRLLPGGKYYDVPGYMAQGLNKVGFDWTLGNIRDWAADGNLMLLKALGRDITDPRQRIIANTWANTNTGWARGAVRAARATREQGAALTPVMTRAQIKAITDLTKLIRPGVDASERIMAASVILTTVGSVVGIGKLINDEFGTEEWVWNPSKRGFGDIRLRNGRHINIIPQWQLRKALATSMKELAEGDPKELKQTWATFGVGRASFPARLGLGAAGVGFQPGEGVVTSGYKGDLLSVAPIPPFAQDVARGELDPLKDKLGAGLTFLGGNTYQESPTAAFSYEFKKATGKDFWDLDGDERDALLDAHPELAQLNLESLESSAERGSVGAQNVLESQEIKEKYASPQRAADEWLRELRTPERAREWREETADRMDRYYAELENQYKNSPEKAPRNEEERVLAERRKVVDANTNAREEVDWDAVNAWEESLPEQQRAILDNLPVKGMTDELLKFAQAKREIAATGYWDIYDNEWEKFTSTRPAYKGMTYDEAKRTVELETKKKYLDSGATERTALKRAQEAGNEVFDRYLEAVTAAQERMIKKDATLAGLLVDYGYKTSKLAQEAAGAR